ncbi:MAG: serine/threonine protein kinase [Myxococcales bacterium]|nr:serine/threonine protein kinase [Myxococcales bacterium]
MSSQATLPSPRSEPERIGRYLLFESIARGGMAQVHLARMVGPVGFSRIVAVKRLHSHLALEPEFVSMFLDEARLAARVQHPNVVPILDVVSLPSELFIVLEYVAGESLAELSRRQTQAGQRLPPAIASAILVGALMGLHAAHEAKSETGAPLEIVHRDVSPQNVMVGTDGLARVVDFGIAHAAERLATTRTGQVKGKPAYMSPEQISGGEVDRRTDVYSTGVMAWELFSGRRLFQAGSDARLFQLVSAGAKPSLGEVAPELPEELVAVVTRAIALDPGQRFSTARDFALALEHALTPASQRAVADWAERVAGPELRERAARVARIEAGEHGTPTSQPAPAPSAAATAVATEHRDAQLEPPPPAGEITVRREPRTEPRAPRDRLWLALVGSLLGAVLFCAIVLVVLAARGRDQTVSPPATALASTPELAAASAPPASARAPVADAEAAPAPSAKPAAKPPVGAARKNPCDPPFTYRGNVKVPKPECF